MGGVGGGGDVGDVGGGGDVGDVGGRGTTLSNEYLCFTH